MNENNRKIIKSYFGNDYESVIESAVIRTERACEDAGCETALSHESIIYRIWDQWETLQPVVDAQSGRDEKLYVLINAAMAGQQ